MSNHLTANEALAAMDQVRGLIGRLQRDIAQLREVVACRDRALAASNAEREASREQLLRRDDVIEGLCRELREARATNKAAQEQPTPSPLPAPPAPLPVSPKRQRVCSVPWCGSIHTGKGLCPRHYLRLKKYHDPYLLKARDAQGVFRLYREVGPGQVELAEETPAPDLAAAARGIAERISVPGVGMGDEVAGGSYRE